MRNRNETYCPRCGTKGLVPLHEGVNEYDSRRELLPRHKNLKDQMCPETTTPQDALRFKEEGTVKEPSSVWPYLR